jgi:hypothetical protein
MRRLVNSRKSGDLPIFDSSKLSGERLRRISEVMLSFLWKV